ncbi:MAG: hypothetical protein ACFFAU_13885 [Candidatus Hodarchaeota archaeon]
MADILELLLSALFGAIATLVLREVYAWKYPELERRRERLEMLLEKVYGPLRVVTWRMELDHQRKHSLNITREEYMEIRRIVFLYGYEFEEDYQKLINSLLNQGRNAISSGVAQLAEKPMEILELIKKTEEKYDEITERLEKLHNMRSGFKNNLKFIICTWRNF